MKQNTHIIIVQSHHCSVLGLTWKNCHHYHSWLIVQSNEECKKYREGRWRILREKRTKLTIISSFTYSSCFWYINFSLCMYSKILILNVVVVYVYVYVVVVVFLVYVIGVEFLCSCCLCLCSLLRKTHMTIILKNL